MSRTVFMRDVFGERACLLMVDIDHVKAISEVHGRVGGDDVLRAFADCMVRTIPTQERPGLPLRPRRDRSRAARHHTPRHSPTGERMLAEIRSLPVRHAATIAVTGFGEHSVTLILKRPVDDALGRDSIDCQCRTRRDPA